MTSAATTEVPAAERFSVRINSGELNAGDPDMQELSPLQRESAKQIEAAVRSRKSRSLHYAVACAPAPVGMTKFRADPRLRHRHSGRNGRLC